MDDDGVFCDGYDGHCGVHADRLDIVGTDDTGLGEVQARGDGVESMAVR